MTPITSRVLTRQWIGRRFGQQAVRAAGAVRGDHDLNPGTPPRAPLTPVGLDRRGPILAVELAGAATAALAGRSQCCGRVAHSWDPAACRAIFKDTNHQNVALNIFEGMEVQGINTTTISQGKIVYQDGDVRTTRGAGRYIDRPCFAPYYGAMKIRRDQRVADAAATPR